MVCSVYIRDANGDVRKCIREGLLMVSIRQSRNLAYMLGSLNCEANGATGYGELLEGRLWDPRGPSPIYTWPNSVVPIPAPPLLPGPRIPAGIGASAEAIPCGGVYRLLPPIRGEAALA